MFMGPLEAVKPWSTKGVGGVAGFLDRVWRMIIDDRAEETRLNADGRGHRADCGAEPRVAQDDPRRDAGHRAVVVQHGHRANDGVHQLFLQGGKAAQIASCGGSCNCSRPSPRTSPKNCGSSWAAVGRWPTSRGRNSIRQLLKEDTVEIPVQVNGKLRGRIVVPAGADNSVMEAAARADEKIAELLAGKNIVKTIVVPGKMVNFVVK